MGSVNSLVKLKKLFNRSGRREIKDDAQGEAEKIPCSMMVQEFLFAHYGEIS